jgi:hypothetical protein
MLAVVVVGLSGRRADVGRPALSRRCLERLRELGERLACSRVRGRSPHADRSRCRCRRSGGLSPQARRLYATAQEPGYSTRVDPRVLDRVCRRRRSDLRCRGSHLAPPGALRGLGMAVLAAAFFAEGLWVYLYERRYYDTAALWAGGGTLVVLAFGRGSASGAGSSLRSRWDWSANRFSARSTLKLSDGTGGGRASPGRTIEVAAGVRDLRCPCPWRRA